MKSNLPVLSWADRTGHRAQPEDAALHLSTTPLSDPAEILRRMPAQALSPALLELLDRMSSVILLTEYSPAEELREIATARPALKEAA